ncbi:TetR/AcrR family transcriptional regulator [Isoptericola jiangsuensis]|uniref:TetR/AcrR family transcriptional regulator n=1 Tax=Isoptericola jiangsuensis TaxID=548579 RepID=UPI003AAE7187
MRETSLRDELVVAATRLLDDGGPDSVTLREVGRVAGVSQTAPYRHFANKADLLATVAARELDRLVAAVEDLVAHRRGPTEMLSTALLHYLDWTRKRPERFRLVFGHWPRENDDLRSAAARATESMVVLVEGAQGAGALPPGDPWRIGAAIRAFVHGVAILEQNGHLLGRDRLPMDGEDLVESFLAGSAYGAFRCSPHDGEHPRAQR